MRDAVGAQRLQHGGAGQDRHPASAGMRQHGRMVAAIVPGADAAAGKGQHQKAEPDAPAGIFHARHRAKRGRRDVGIVQHRLHEILVLGLAPDLVAGGDEAGDRQSRQQQREGEEINPPRRIPALGAQPVMDADGGMRPHRQHRQRLHGGEPGEDHPLRQQHGRIEAGRLQRFFGDARADDVRDQQQRDGEAERKLRPFPAGKPERATDIDRPQRIAVMQEQRRREDAGARPGAPGIHQRTAHRFGVLERDQQQRVGAQMADHECEQDERAREPHGTSRGPPIEVHVGDLRHPVRAPQHSRDRESPQKSLPHRAAQEPAQSAAACTCGPSPTMRPSSN